MTDSNDPTSHLNLPPIPHKASLSQWQSYVGEVVRKRGWNKASDLEVFLLFSEEVGELAKAFRQHLQLFGESAKDQSTESSEKKDALASEMADVLSYLLDLANRMDIDLEKAAIAKEIINRGRHWDY